MQINWSDITSRAYMLLLELNYPAFPIPPEKIKCKEAMIISYQEFSKRTNVSIERLTCGRELDDAFLIKGLRPNMSFVFYNKEKYDNRLKHTLLHEIGHLKCGHKKHGEKEEIEAHYFAAQANAPNVLIKEISKRGYNIDVSFLQECFGISEESAQKKKDYLSTYGFNHTNPNDDLILKFYKKYIDSKYPPKTASFYDDYFDRMEQERNDWF